MKKLVISLILLSLILIVGACQSKKDNNDSQEKSTLGQSIPEDSIISMTGHPAILNNLSDTIKVSIKNNTKLEATTGEYFEIEQYVENTNLTGWQRIPLELFFIDIAYILRPGDSREFSISLHPEMHKYESGKYRITKKAHTEEGNYDLFFPFEINLQ